ncbi:PGPGW domain-containing protein [Thiocapsa marina]|uniref:Transmembrane protein (PGPGW) n=1 Tax=Thiocapsa marina 5811 TaxID=768671 RepID=F9UE95_9GAMM|nr:PGPGW domain-containing protein [Thiocapsa marina]EGV17652.1 Protein of unknown function, PGPGW, transmembrane [Thiocapsa marina 5811]
MIDMIWVEAHQGLLLSLAGASVLMFIGSLIALPFLLARIPEDYFVDPHRHSARLKSLHPVVYVSLRLFKNLVGWVLVLAGILMLVLPGQGILTIIMGLVLSDFPGKYALERRLASKQRVLDGINWIRRRSGHPPLVPPQI